MSVHNMWELKVEKFLYEVWISHGYTHCHIYGGTRDENDGF
jgi:hypothetical protein